MKKCSYCKTIKENHDFYVDRAKKDGLSCMCKKCSKDRRISWRADNQIRNKLYVREWKDKNKGRWNAIKSKYKSRKLKASPSWLTEHQLKEIVTIYEMASELTKATGINYHVDHICPLQGNTSCGLHVPWNLQILKAKDNIAKGNKLLS